MSAGKSFGIWSHPPGLNRRPADYESANILQVIANPTHPRAFSATCGRNLPAIEQAIEQESCRCARSRFLGGGIG